MNEERRRMSKVVVVVCIAIPIATLHFFTGSSYAGPYPVFVNGYLLDILVPLSFYFLLSLNEFYPLNNWVVKATLVFGAAALVEVAQLFGVPLFGRTYDPTDFIMYGLGVSFAVFLDMVAFPRIFGFWKT
jgi:hypothetical protein